MKPANLHTKIFLDSGNPQDTREVLEVLGFLDGQTTNPSLIAKNPQIQATMKNGETLSNEDVQLFYKGVIQEISSLIPHGSVSIEVYADANTNAQDILAQAKDMYTWVDNAHMKFPVTSAGLEAAEMFTKDGGRVNMTLVFSQQQGAAVHAATSSAQKGAVYLSPFIGRLDDKGKNGMDLIANTLKMYRDNNSHVQVLVASVRTLDHFMAAIALDADIITAPKHILLEWAGEDMHVPDASFIYDTKELSPIAYEQLDLSLPYSSFDVTHPLTDAGLQKFADDWNTLISN